MSYAIIVTDARTGNRLELCHVDTNPEPVTEAARLKTYTIRKKKFRTYSSVEVIEMTTTANEREAT
jgi:hypothetical protein